MALLANLWMIHPQLSRTLRSPMCAFQKGQDRSRMFEIRRVVTGLGSRVDGDCLLRHLDPKVHLGVRRLPLPIEIPHENWSVSTQTNQFLKTKPTPIGSA